MSDTERVIKKITVTDPTTGADYTEQIEKLYGPWSEAVYMPGNDREFVEREHPSFPIREKDSFDPLIYQWLEDHADVWSGYSADWEGGAGAWVVSYIEDGQAHSWLIYMDSASDNFPLGEAMTQLGLVFDIEYEDAPAAVHELDDFIIDDGMFGISTSGQAGRAPTVASFQHHDVDMGITITAGLSVVDLHTKLIMVDTGEHTGHIRIVLNDAPVWDGDPEKN